MYMNPRALEPWAERNNAMTITANRISIFSFLIPPCSSALVFFIMSGIVDAVGISGKSKKLSFAEIR